MQFLTSPKEDSRKKQDAGIMQMRLVRVNKHLPQLQAELHHHQHTPYYSIVPVERTITFVLKNTKSSIQLDHNLQKSSKLTKFSEHCISSWLPEDTSSSESYFRTKWTCQKTAGGRSVENKKNISNKKSHATTSIGGDVHSSLQRQSESGSHTLQGDNLHL